MIMKFWVTRMARQEYAEKMNEIPSARRGDEEVGVSWLLPDGIKYEPIEKHRSFVVLGFPSLYYDTREN